VAVSEEDPRQYPMRFQLEEPKMKDSYSRNGQMLEEQQESMLFVLKLNVP
jgi:hypothetical protein